MICLPVCDLGVDAGVVAWDGQNLCSLELTINCVLRVYFLSLSPHTGGPRPAQKEIISLRALILLFLKQLILKVHPVFMAQTTCRWLNFGHMEIVSPELFSFATHFLCVDY